MISSRKIFVSYNILDSIYYLKYDTHVEVGLLLISLYSLTDRSSKIISLKPFVSRLDRICK